MTRCVVLVCIGKREYSATVESADVGGYYVESDKLRPLVHQLCRHLATHRRLNVYRLSLDMRQPALSLSRRMAAMRACLPVFREVEKNARRGHGG